MKNLIILAIGIMTFANTAWSVPGQPNVRDVIVNIADVYIPSGFDDQTDAFIVTNGWFHNSCYRWKKALVDHQSEFSHEVTVVGEVSEGLCLNVMVPFTKEIRMGRLASGEHTLRFDNGDGTYLQRKFVVE